VKAISPPQGKQATNLYFKSVSEFLASFSQIFSCRAFQFRALYASYVYHIYLLSSSVHNTLLRNFETPKNIRLLIFVNIFFSDTFQILRTRTKTGIIPVRGLLCSYKCFNSEGHDYFGIAYVGDTWCCFTRGCLLIHRGASQRGHFLTDKILMLHSRRWKPLRRFYQRGVYDIQCVIPNGKLLKNRPHSHRIYSMCTVFVAF